MDHSISFIQPCIMFIEAKDQKLKNIQYLWFEWLMSFLTLGHSNVQVSSRFAQNLPSLLGLHLINADFLGIK